MNHLSSWIKYALCCIVALTGIQCSSSQSAKAQKDTMITLQQTGAQVKVSINGKHFTTYQQPEEIKKPILYPIISPKGTAVTRGYPIDPRPGERVDHPHHIGVWLNHGDVNDLDFWNHSANVKPERKDRYGTIVHREINLVESGEEQGILDVTMDWQGPDGQILLEETTRFIFSVHGEGRSIERQTILTAVADTVRFEDNKEGMFGIRLARELEQVVTKPALYLDADGQVMTEKIVDTTGVSGLYRNAAGQIGNEVWGTRGPWVCIDGKMGNEEVSVAIFDHPDNIGSPASWHARGYGLFSVNNLGRKAYNKSEERFDVTVMKGDKISFKHELLVFSHRPTDEELQKAFKEFSQ